MSRRPDRNIFRSDYAACRQRRNKRKATAMKMRKRGLQIWLMVTGGRDNAALMPKAYCVMQIQMADY